MSRLERLARLVRHDRATPRPARNRRLALANGLEVLEGRALLTLVMTASTPSQLASDVRIANSFTGGAVEIDLTGASCTMSRTLELSGKSGPVTIRGYGRFGFGSTTVSLAAGGQGPVFKIDSGVTANLLSLTITGGSTGVVNAGTTTMSTCDVMGNGNLHNSGGGIENFGTMSISLSKVTGNVKGNENVDNSGGGIENRGTMSISQTLVEGNSDPYGGGVDNSGTLTVTGSMITNNTATFYGGGLRNTGVAAVVNTSVTGNSSLWGAGVENDSGALTLTSDVVSNNSGILNGFGGGVYNAKGAQVTIQSSTIASNTIGCGGGISNSGVMTITGSNVSNNSASFYNGGGILNYGTLTVTSSTVSGNSSVVGGGMYNLGGASVSYSQITKNSATQSGGGLQNGSVFPGVTTQSKLTVLDCTVSGNTAATGAGVCTYYPTSLPVNYSQWNLYVSNSTIDHNTATDHGAGIDIIGARAIVVNSTIAANAVQSVTQNGGGGGGIDNDGTLLAVCDTVAGNTVSTPNGRGAGIENRAVGYEGMAVYDSILADNRLNNTANDLAGTLGASSSYNVIGTLLPSYMVNPSKNRVGADPHLSALGNWGGPTQTMFPGIGSAAKGAGSASIPGVVVPTKDQRGVSRDPGWFTAGAVQVG